MAQSTGSAELPDIGSLTYNGVTFSSLYTSQVSGKQILDAGNRTVKYVKYTLAVDAMITLDDDVGDDTTDRIMLDLRKRLQVQAGVLKYSGKGFGQSVVVNAPGGLYDVAWGPIPELLEFIPMGSSRAAKVKWNVSFCIPEIRGVGGRLGPVLEFSYHTSVSYDSAGFSHIGIGGILEIPLTRPLQATRTLTQTVDDFRQEFLGRIANDFDLQRFRVTDRGMEISDDKRTLTFDFSLDEQPYMGVPGGMFEADGHYTVKPERVGVLSGTVNWICTFKATYTVVKGLPRRVAYMAFLAMWDLRMRMSQFGFFVGQPIQWAIQRENAANQVITQFNNRVADIIEANIGNVPLTYQRALGVLPAANNSETTSSFPLSLSIDEGMYLSSRTISFEASWRIITRWQGLLVAAGIWRQTGLEGGNFYATSMANISGAQSWLRNELDPAAQAIVDFGG